MHLSKIVDRGLLAAIVIGAVVELSSLAYSRHVLNDALAAGARIPLAGSDQNLVYRSTEFTAGWMDGTGHGELLLPTPTGRQPIAIPVTLTTRQGISLDGSVVRIAVKVQLPPKVQKEFDGLNDPEPIAADLRIFPWKAWTMHADVKRAWGNVGMLEVNFAGADVQLKRSWSSIRSNLSIGRFEAYQADRSSGGFTQEALQLTSEEVVAKGRAHSVLSLTAHGLQLGHYLIPLITLQGSSDTMTPFDPTDNYLLTPPPSSGSVVHFADVEVHAVNKGLLKANADITIPPFDEGNLADLIEALRKGFKLRTSIDFDSAFSTYFDDVGEKLSAGPQTNSMTSLFRPQDGHYVCNVSYEAGRAVINGREITLPNKSLIPGLFVPQALIPQAAKSVPLVPLSPGNAVLPSARQDVEPQMSARPLIPQPAQVSIPLDRMPFRVGESISEVQVGLAEIGSHLPIPQGRVANIHLNQRGIWLFFGPSGTVRTIRLDWPFVGRIQGIGLGDTEAGLLNVMGPPVRPPWTFGGNVAYLYQGADGMIRYDVGNGRVRTIFELSQSSTR